MSLRRVPALLAAVLLLATPALAAPRRRPVQTPKLDACGPASMTSDTSYISAVMAADDRFVYFGDDIGFLYKVSKSGGSVQQVAVFPEAPIQVMTQDATMLYVVSAPFDSFLATIYAIPKAGGTNTALATGVVLPFELSTDATSVYWVSAGTPTADDSFLSDGKVEKVSKTGTGRTTLASGLSVPVTITIDAATKTAFFGETGLAKGNASAGLRSVSTDGGTVKKLASEGLAVVTIALSATDVYYGTFDSDKFIGTIARQAKSGGAVTTLTSNILFPSNLVLTSDRAYFFDEELFFEQISYVPLAGGDLHTVVEDEFNAPVFALDDCAVYYVDFDGTVKRRPR